MSAPRGPGDHARADPTDWRLYLVTDPHLGGGRDAVPDIVHQAVLGGVGVVQVRDKECDDDEFAARAVAVAEAVARACTETGRSVPVFVNDRLDVARELGLHLHVGQGDVPFARARDELPEHLMLGLSIESDAQLAAALAGPGPAPDVIGVSPVWATSTKTDTAPELGPEGADRLARAAHAHRGMGGRGTGGHGMGRPGAGSRGTGGRGSRADQLTGDSRGGVRAVGIGGITPSNVARLAVTALDGVCVVSAIMAAPDPRVAAADLLRRWDRARGRTREY